MDYIYDRTDNAHILDHAEWAFESYSEDDYENLIEFYEEWIDQDSMPDIDNYL